MIGSIKKEDGQGLAEYALIISLIVVLIFMFFGRYNFGCSVKSHYINALYSIHIVIHQVSDSETFFTQFMVDNGFNTSHYEYSEGKIKCSIHPDDSAPENPGTGTVPWL